MNKLAFFLMSCLLFSGAAHSQEALPGGLAVEHDFVQSGDVKIHVVSLGEGPLIVLLHGFPDYWYTWRHQMPELSKHYKVIAVDQRGYNTSDQPSGVEHYTVEKLIADVRAVIEHFGEESAIVVGHDWGGLVAWSFAMQHPEMTQRLVVLNLPHPWGLQRELVNNPQQAENSQYARDFQQPDAHKSLTATGLAGWVRDEPARAFYLQAFRRSSFQAMLNYYKANYPKPPYTEPEQAPPKVKCPTLVIHGLKDRYLLAAGLNDTWQWVDNRLTIVTVPEANHFVQHDKPRVVTQTLLRWLVR